MVGRIQNVAMQWMVVTCTTKIGESQLFERRNSIKVVNSFVTHVKKYFRDKYSVCARIKRHILLHDRTS
jgi:hypothetical protein